MTSDKKTAAEPGATQRTLRLLLVGLAGLTLVRLACAASFELIEAEAYYWTWSRHLAAGYFDHPPVIAFLIRVTTGLVGDTPLGVRLGPVILGTLGPLAFYCFCRRLAGSRGAAWATGFLAVAPFYLPFGMLATPDAPLLFFWILSLWAFYAAWETGRPLLWLAAGLATGLCIISKYNGLQLPICFFAFLFLTKRGRRYLKGPLPWLALLVTAAVIAPNMWWNLQRGGAALGIPGSADGAVGLEESTGQIGVFLALIVLEPTPLVFVAWVKRTLGGLKGLRLLRDERVLFCVLLSWFPLAGFGTLSFIKIIHAHWVAPCLIAALPMVAEAFEPDGSRLDRKLARGGTWLAAVAALVALVMSAVTAWMPLRWAESMPEPVVETMQEVRGHDQMLERLRLELAERRDDPRLFVMGKNFHFSGLLSWLLREGHSPPVLPLERKNYNQYAIWYRDGMFEGWNAIFVDHRPHRKRLRHLRDAFETVEFLPPIEVTEDGIPVREFHIYYCEGFRGPI